MAIDDKVNKGRRSILGLAGKAAALAASYSVASTVAKLIPETKAGGDDYESMLRTYMIQPVEETLRGMTNLHYTSEHDLRNNILAKPQDKPFMVMFYSDRPEAVGNNPSRGLAALARVIGDKFRDEMDLVAYKVDNTEGQIGGATESHLLRTYPITTVPALAFYDNDNGINTHKGTVNGGFDSVTGSNGIRARAEQFSKYIPSNILG